MDELHHECGLAAIYHLPGGTPSRLAPLAGPEQVSRLMPRLLLDLQNRGQLAAGFSTFSPHREKLLDTYKQIGTVIEAFRLNHQAKRESIMREYAGRAAIGHVRYATCGATDRSYAQPFERPHGCKWKRLSFALNGQHAHLAQLGEVRRERYAPEQPRAHCFFEWIYFANVASTLDSRSVYLTRAALGQELARQERQLGRVPLDADTIVVPVPDTGKAAADAMAFALGLPSVEGLIRNRYVGRTFIEGQNRAERVLLKYTPLREVLEGKRVLLIEDTIVRSTTMKTLLRDLRERGGAREVHVRVACPPIVAPCFYGIDMSTMRELFAPRYMKGLQITEAEQDQMAKDLGADSLLYLPIEAIARCIGLEERHLCRACLTADYPTATGERLYQLSLRTRNAPANGRTYELASGRAPVC